MAFCPNCGSTVEGKFCAKCGAAVNAPAADAGGTAPPPPAAGAGGAVPPPPAAGAASLGMDENVAAALCYIPIIGLIFLIIEPYNKNRTIKFHALQSLFYCIAWVLVGIVLGIFGSMFALMAGMFWFWWMIGRLVNLALFVGLVIMAVKAFQGSRFVMPIIGPIAEKQAAA